MQNKRALGIWLESGEISLESAESGIEDIESLLGEIKTLIEKKETKEAWEAYTKLQIYLSFMGAAAQQQPKKQPKIVKKLFNNISTFKSYLEAIAKQLNANSFSISAGFPWGISISISFPIPP